MIELFERVRRVSRTLLICTGIPASQDRRAFRRAFRRDAQRTAEHVLLGAPGAGNVGDQAMFEAFLERTTGTVILITRRVGDLTVPAEHIDRVSVHPLLHLLYGSGRRHRDDVARLAAMLSTATSFCVVGADIMDGRYVLRASVNRSVLAGAAAACGVPTRILGFSGNGKARAAARRQLVVAARLGAVPIVRDPVSLRRAGNDGVPGLLSAADIVFSATSTDHTWAARYSSDKPLAVVNVSGLISREVDQTGEYVSIVEHLLGHGFAVLLLPHVSHSAADDVTSCAQVHERVGTDRVMLAPGLPSPAQVRGLTQVAEIVVTGRMHLAIMSFANGTPAITLATQGKVEGLTELLGAPELCVTPVPGFGAEVVKRLTQILPEGSAVRRAVDVAVPRIEELSLLNTRGLSDAIGHGASNPGAELAAR